MDCSSIFTKMYTGHLNNYTHCDASDEVRRELQRQDDEDNAILRLPQSEQPAAMEAARRRRELNDPQIQILPANAPPPIQVVPQSLSSPPSRQRTQQSSSRPNPSYFRGSRILRILRMNSSRPPYSP